MKIIIFEESIWIQFCNEMFKLESFILIISFSSIKEFWINALIKLIVWATSID